MPYMVAPAEQTHVPFMTWFSQDEITEQGIDIACLQKRANDEDFSHDNFSHTILGLFDIFTSEYDPSLDVLSACKSNS
jgi:lipid A ethanolaminephosphotransferase